MAGRARAAPKRPRASPPRCPPRRQQREIRHPKKKLKITFDSLSHIWQYAYPKLTEPERDLQ